MPSPVSDGTLRTAVGAVCVFVGLVAFTEYTLRSLAPVVILSAGTLAYGAADEAYDLPRGAAATAYGAGLVAAGAYVASEYVASLGGAVALAGVWFVLDGATTIRYGPARTPHEFVSGPESEVLLRMRVLHTVHRRLRARDGPRTPASLARSCDLAEPTVRSALDYLERRGQVTRTERGYRAASRPWGRLTPVVRFVSWLPRRALRPLRRVRDDASG